MDRTTAAHHCGYRLFGEFWLDSPDELLIQDKLERLNQLEPYLRDLEERLKLRKFSSIGVQCASDQPVF